MYAKTPKPNFAKAKLILIICCLTFPLMLLAQDEEENKAVTIYQYRQVDPENVEEFIKRETTYWSEVAKKGMEKGNLQFWALLQKVGGFDMPNSPNFLFINTFKNIDEMAGTWDPAAVFPDVDMEEMETNSISTTMHNIFVQSRNWVEKEGVNPDESFNYVQITYHSSSAPAQYISLEKEHWEPMVKKAMDEGKTPQVAWGNSIVLSPTGGKIKYNTLSFDMYSSLSDALTGGFEEGVEIPEELFEKLGEIQINPRLSYIYRVVKVESAQADE